jgi:hypothetical protein
MKEQTEERKPAMREGGPGNQGTKPEPVRHLKKEEETQDEEPRVDPESTDPPEGIDKSQDPVREIKKKSSDGGKPSQKQADPLRTL